MASDTKDKLAIRELIENWAIFRDGLMWDRFRTVWHKDGRMWATWFQGSAEEFIDVSKKGYANGVRIFHQLSGTSIDVKGKRAIAMTKMTITQRGTVDGEACDVICAGRFYDFLEKRQGKWGIVLRRLIYEMDRLVPLDPAASAQARQENSRSLPDRIPPPRLFADQRRLQRKARSAGHRWPGGRCALCERRGLAEGEEDLDQVTAAR